MQKKPTQPFIVLIIGIFAISGAAVFIRLASAPPLVIATYRMLLATLILLPYTWTRHRGEYRRLKRRDWGILALSGTALAVHFAAWITSLRYTSVASSTVLVSSQPIFIMVLSYLLFRESSKRHEIVGTLLAIGGSLMIGLADAGAATPNPLKGDLLALLGALAAAVYFLAGRDARRRMGVIPYATVVYGISALVLIVFTGAGGIPLWPYPLRDWLLFFALALICTVIGHSSLNWALAYLPPAAVGIATLGEPLGASILAFTIWRELPTGLQLLGSAILLTGIALFLLPDRKANSSP